MMGHSSPLMTLTRYAQADVRAQRVALERVAGGLTNLVYPDRIRTHGSGTAGLFKQASS